MRRLVSGRLLENWRRNYLAVWPSLFVVSLGLMAVIPTLPLYVEQQFGIQDPHEVRVWAGVAFAAGPLASAFAGPFWGALGDRVGRKVMVVRSLLAIAVATALAPLARDPLLLTALRFVQGMFAGYVAPAMALVSASTPRERQGRTLAGLQVALALGLLVGPVVGAEVAAVLGRGAVFWVTSALALVAVVPVVVFAREDRSQLTGREEGRTWAATFRRDFGELFGQRLLLALLGCVLLLRLGLHMVEPFLALWTRELGPLPFLAARSEDLEHALDRTTAAAFTILALAQFLVTPIWGRFADRYGPLRCLAVAAFALGVLLLATSFVTTIEGFLALRVPAALFMASTMTLAYAAVGRRVPERRRALAFAVVQSCIQLGLACGPMFGALVATGDSVRPLFRVGAAAAVLAGLGMLLVRRRSRPAVVVPAEPRVAEPP